MTKCTAFAVGDRVRPGPGWPWGSPPGIPGTVSAVRWLPEVGPEVRYLIEVEWDDGRRGIYCPGPDARPVLESIRKAEIDFWENCKFKFWGVDGAVSSSRPSPGFTIRPRTSADRKPTPWDPFEACRRAAAEKGPSAVAGALEYKHSRSPRQSIVEIGLDDPTGETMLADALGFAGRGKPG